MNTLPRIEGRMDESSPLDAWFTAAREAIQDEVLSVEIERAEAIDHGDKAALIRLINARDVLDARQEHLVELSFMCDPSGSIASIANRLGEHESTLSAVLTSQNDLAVILAGDMKATGHIKLGVEEAKVRAKIADTTSLIHKILE